MGVVLDTVGKLIAGYLQKEVPGYEPFTPSDPEHLRGIIEQGDVLLVEGNNRVSGIIKYLTQSTWSHAALFAVSLDGAIDRADEQCGMRTWPLGQLFDDAGNAVVAFDQQHVALFDDAAQMFRIARRERLVARHFLLQVARDPLADDIEHDAHGVSPRGLLQPLFPFP